MATFYINPVAGNDSNDGLSFSNAWKTITNGATQARINPGDEIRIMESPAPTLVGSALWTNGFNTANKSISGATNASPIQITCSNHGYANNDYVIITGVNGNTNANGIWQIANTSTNTFDLVGSTGNASYTYGGTLRNINSNIVKLASAATKDIVLTDNIGTVSSNGANWTASANVTSAIDNLGFMPTRVSLTIASAFTTGKVAYKTIPSTDFSAYQQISLQFSQTAGTLLNSGDIKICLCSDTIGNVIVDQFLIPTQPYLNTYNIPITINKGSALGSAIQSIAIYVVNDTGATTISLSNVIAVKSTSSADNISLTSMIGKNNDEYFLPILGIKNNIVILYYVIYTNVNWLNLTSANSGYYGTTETINTYKIEPFYAFGLENAATINNSGTIGNYISFSGGWNRTDMSTQTSSTYFSGQGSTSAGFGSSIKNYIDISKINLSKYMFGYLLSNCTYCNISDLCISGSDLGGIALSSGANIITIGKNKNGITNKITGLFCFRFITGQLDNCIIQDIFGASSSGAIEAQGSMNKGIITYIENAISKNCNYAIGAGTGCTILANTITAEYCVSSAIFHNLSFIKIKFLTCNYCSSYCINNSYGNTLIDKIIANGNNGTYLFYSAYSSKTNINSGIFGNITPNLSGFIFLNEANTSTFNFSNVTGIPASPTYYNYPYLLTFTNCIDTNSNVLNYSTNISDYKVSKDTSIYHGTTGTSWKLEQISANINQYNKIEFSVAKIAVNANKLTTISLWFKNSSSTITGQLVCPGYQLSGTDVVATTSTSTDWQKLTISFTPTTEKVIEIFAYAYSNQNDYLYVSDMSVTK